MHLHVGLAVSSDNGKTFKRYSKSPILERNSIDPFLTATLSILKEKIYTKCGMFLGWVV